LLNIPPTEAIIAAIEAARTGSMAAAADELGITHGAVSRRIQSLEHWLGSPVFERMGRGVRLTPQGTVFLRRAERSLTSIESLRSELGSHRDDSTVVISALPSMVRLWLMPRLRVLEASIPGRRVEIIPEYRLAQVQARDMDVAIRYGMGSWSGVETHLLYPDLAIPAAAPKLASELAGCSAQDLMKQTLLIDGDGADWRQWCRLADVPYPPTVRKRQFLDHDVAIEATRQGLGIILLRAPLAAIALQNQSLCALPFPTVQSGRGHYVALRSGEQRPHVHSLADAIRVSGTESLADFSSVLGDAAVESHHNQ
jgi:LysR family transcriptional regulator, glycine cleavage system transcriptional activator